MRPTVTEQLEGMCRILESAVAPALANDYTLETLRSLVANVRMLGRAWHQILPFLHWDNNVMMALLTTAAHSATPELQAHINSALAVTPADNCDSQAAQARNEQLRTLLTACLDGPPDLVAAISSHLIERSQRYPLRLTGAVPKHKG